jgi:hypothetical protein
VKVKCPWCGATGTDQKPYSEESRRQVAELTGNPVKQPTKAEQDYAFEVRGNYGGRPVRKCLNCGNGVRVTILPPRFRKVPPDEWLDLQQRWEQFLAEQERYRAQRG